MRRPSATTIVLLLGAGAAVTAVHADPWSDEGAVAPLVSTKSNARRLLPEIQDRTAEGATIELKPVHGEPTRIVPVAGGGHAVFAGEEPLGPADPEAVDGLWASLRMATTLRAVDDDAIDDPGQGGQIRVMAGDAVHELWLGRPAPDGAGLYGGRVRAPENLEGTWVVEREIGELLQQAPRAWLAVRAVVVEPAQVKEVSFSDGLTLRRGADHAWRSELSGTQAILADTAVEHRLHRLVSARLDPLLSPASAPVDTSVAPWLGIRAEDGRDFVLWRGEACPGRPERVLVSRGPGLVGCLDAALTEPWPAVGRGRPDDDALLDAHLLPAAYGRVLSIAQSQPHERVLARHGGGWRVEEGGTATEVEESEVFRWYEAARSVEVRLSPDAPEGAPDLDLALALDSATTLRLRCAGRGDERRCRRDEGPWLTLHGPAPELAFEVTTFRDRRLVDLSVDDARALEVLPGPGSVGTRQGAHFDLGVWRLDAPLHPAGDEALDEDKLQEMLAAVAGARIEAWLQPTDAAPLRTFRIDRTPRRGEDATVVVELLPGCAVRLPGGRPGRVSEGACTTLEGHLLRTDVIAPLLLGADTVEVEVAKAPAVRLRDDEGTLVREDGAPMGELSDVLAGLEALRGVELRAGTPSGAPTIRLRVRPRRGEPYGIDVGDGWLAFEGASWWMRTEDAGARE